MRVRFGSNSLLLDAFNSPAAPPPVRGETVSVHFAPGDGQLLDQPIQHAEAAE